MSRLASSRSFWTAAVCLALFAGGCTVKLNPKLPNVEEAPPEAAGTLGIPASVPGIPQILGHGTFTVFAIPVADVKLKKNTDGGKILSEKLASVLKLAGFEAAPYESVLQESAAAGTPALNFMVGSCDFSNYTYFFPIVPTWGHFNIAVSLHDTGGKQLWQRYYKAKSMNLFYSFSSAVNSAASKAFNKFYREINTSAFKKLASDARAPASSPQAEPPAPPNP